jgi:hypothetical protein
VQSRSGTAVATPPASTATNEHDIFDFAVGFESTLIQPLNSSGITARWTTPVYVFTYFYCSDRCHIRHPKGSVSVRLQQTEETPQAAAIHAQLLEDKCYPRLDGLRNIVHALFYARIWAQGAQNWQILGRGWSDLATLCADAAAGTAHTYCATTGTGSTEKSPLQ